jgi:hypothetical protein
MLELGLVVRVRVRVYCNVEQENKCI